MKWTDLAFVFLMLFAIPIHSEEYWKKISYPEYIGDSGIITSDGVLNAIAVESSGTIWIGGRNGGIYQIESEV